jgi:phosphoglycolate phosphatase-like HAD superfamily hydrolase
VQKSVLITDVDNTLFDWQEIWFECFSALADEAMRISGIEPEKFYAEASIIHQKYGTSEYAFLLEEMPSLRSQYGDRVLEVLAPAIDAFRAKRRLVLKLYGGVEDTLIQLKASGIKIVAYTESQAYYTGYRFRKLGLDHLIDFLYSPPDHDLPASPENLRYYPSDTYQLAMTEHRHTPPNELKPNPDILLSIIRDIGADKGEVAYIGDSKLKDVFMAQQAGVLDVYAEYGAARHPERYDLLKKVTHWTPEMVERERQSEIPGAVNPTVVCSQSFSEISEVFR